MKYRVHLYVTTRVPFDVEANSQQEAIDEASRQFHADAEQLTKTGEFADEVVSALVDEEGDVDYVNSRNYELGCGS